MIEFFRMHWLDVPTAWIDTETTGKYPGVDRTVQVGIARFEAGKPVAHDQWLVDPGIPIPAEATAIHGITDEMVKGAPTLAELFAGTSIQHLLEGAQPGAFNSPFDRNFVPPIGDHSWPWLDCLSFVRKTDRYAPGKARHRLEATCKRHGIELQQAHSAGADARAAGELFYKLARENFPKIYTMGQALGWQRRIEAVEWFRFFEFKTSPRKESAPQ